MVRLKLLLAAVAAGLVISPHGADAHCDALDGPVAQAVHQALMNGNVNPVLAYAPASAELEIRSAFGRARKVRALGADAQELADQAFLETVIRLHRAGEGAAYTGVKPAGIDYGPAIPAAERALETGETAELKAVLAEAIDHAMRERLAHVRELQKAAREPKTPDDVAAARERISAELSFISYAELVFQAAQGQGAHSHADE